MGRLRYYPKQYEYMKGKIHEMTDEMSDNAFWAIVVSVIAGCITTTILGAMVMNLATTRWYVRAGYTKTTLPGRSAIVWVKEAK